MTLKNVDYAPVQRLLDNKTHKPGSVFDMSVNNLGRLSQFFNRKKGLVVSLTHSAYQPSDEEKDESWRTNVLYNRKCFMYFDDDQGREDAMENLMKLDADQVKWALQRRDLHLYAQGLKSPQKKKKANTAADNSNRPPVEKATIAPQEPEL